MGRVGHPAMALSAGKIMSDAKQNTKDLQELAKEAAPIARNAILRSIDLVSIDAERKAGKRVDAEELQVGGKHSVRHDFTSESEDSPPRLTVFCAFAVDLKDAEDVLFSFRSTFSLTYDLSRGMPEDAEQHLHAFAQSNSILHAWPYFRELVQSTAWRMGFPPFALPLFRIGGPHSKKPSGP